jgi:hypothetical protein
MEAQQENKTAVPTREQARESLLGRLTSPKEGQAPLQFTGMPFKWAAGFACLCLASLFLGHWITIRGQEMINTMSQKQPVQYAPVPQTPAVIKVEPQSSQKTDRSEEVV